MQDGSSRRRKAVKLVLWFYFFRGMARLYWSQQQFTLSRPRIFSKKEMRGREGIHDKP
jgi:hypothetical protein